MNARQEARQVVIDEILEVLVANTGSPTLALSKGQALEMGAVLFGAALEVLRRAGLRRAEAAAVMVEALRAYPKDFQRVERPS